MITAAQLLQLGYPAQRVASDIIRIHAALALPPEQAWRSLRSDILSQSLPPAVHTFLFQSVYPEWPEQPERAAAWFADEYAHDVNHLAQFMQENGHKTVPEFLTWSQTEYRTFWQRSVEKVGIHFKTAYSDICDLTQGVENPRWFADSTLNIVDSCFKGSPDRIAIISATSNGLQKTSIRSLQILVNQISNSLLKANIKAHDRIAIVMPLNMQAVAIYLAIIQIGAVVVSVPDSFSSEEIATRLNITDVRAVFTQDVLQRGEKTFPLYQKIRAVFHDTIIVFPEHDSVACELDTQTMVWREFLKGAAETFVSVPCDPMQACHILFSSGTTGTPKAIPWNHTTPMKAAIDAFLHHNIHADDTLAWPTNLGWMMGPWLIFAALINGASLALYSDAPTSRAFGKFIQAARVTMLGVVPSLVSNWKHSGCMEDLDWSAIRAFSSTGECSNPNDMLFLMSLANYKPVIEYCGGTEIGGAYVSSTLLQNNYPAVFTTPTMGTTFVLLDDDNHVAQNGQVALVPPILGLSTTLVNADHHEIYYENMPRVATHVLRRHGDQLCQYENGFYSVLGRSDDTMNLGGIKISAVEIERALVHATEIIESAAICVAPLHNGPSQLVIYCVTCETQVDLIQLKKSLQQQINLHLNPLFKIYQVVTVDALPKTASNKIMRKVLRQQYESFRLDGMR